MKRHEEILVRFRYTIQGYVNTKFCFDYVRVANSDQDKSLGSIQGSGKKYLPNGYDFWVKNIFATIE